MRTFTKSERRQFERDVYDYAEALGLDHADSKKQVIKARGFCGEEDYDSDNSALGDETDDSNDILERLHLISEREPEVWPSIENAHTGPPTDISGSKPSPKKSPYFTASSTALNPQSKRKRESDVSSGLKEMIAVLEDDRDSKKQKNPNSSAELEALGSKKARAAARKARRKAHKAEEAQRAKEMSIAADRKEPETEVEVQKPGKRAARQARQAEARSDAAERENVGALEPKTEVEAHENHLRSNQQDPYNHGPTLDQTEAERAQIAKEEAVIIEKIRGDVQYTNEKQVDLYQHGHMNHERQEVKDDLKILKKVRDNDEAIQKGTNKSKGKKGVKAVDDSNIKVKKSHKKEDFQSPMIR